MRSVLAISLGLIVVACSQGSTPSPSQSVPESYGPRPSSPAMLTITAPVNGATVTGSSVHVSMTLTGATITSVTTASISPTLGHIHLYVDGSLTSMNYSTEEDLPVTPGSYVLRAEFVAADHAPFDPRVWSNQVVFTVQ